MWLSRQPWYSFSEEINIEDLKRRFPDLMQYDYRFLDAAGNVTAHKPVTMAVYRPMEILIDPSIDPSTVELRAADGKVLSKIVNMGLPKERTDEH
jgi:hypothetical protein